jgi:hypothetical protein
LRTKATEFSFSRVVSGEAEKDYENRNQWNRSRERDLIAGYHEYNSGFYSHDRKFNH